VMVQVIKARYLDPAAAPSRSGCNGALSPSGFRLPLSGVIRGSGLREAVTGFVDIRGLPVVSRPRPASVASAESG